MQSANFRIVAACLMLAFFGFPLSVAIEGATAAWGDRGDGTYENPVMPGDFSDIDAIRVGADYYLISSTFQYSPGMAVLQSKDLVNWRIVGHVVNDLTRISPELNWDRMNRAGRGIWAGSIRFHDRQFWVYFGTPDEGLFVSHAPHAEGPWTPVERVLQQPGWDDPCPFWDEDGTGYLVATNFKLDPANGKSYNIHLFRLTSDNEHLLPDSDLIIHQSKGSEANKLYKINGAYFHLYSEVRPEGRVVMMDRASSLRGRWETRQLIHVQPKIDKEPNQGGLVELPNGIWYFVSHQGRGDWEGRAGVLLPITWIDGWPVLGRPGADGIGNMVWSGAKPIAGFPLTSLVADGNFDSKVLKSEWEWNYQPRSDAWSLSEHPGFLRLHAFAPLRLDDFRTIGNILTQRSLRTRLNEFTAHFDLLGLASGQQAGIAHFAKTYCTLAVVQDGSQRTLLFNDNGERTAGPVLSSQTVWLRSTWDYDGRSQFSYSTDGQNFRDIGVPYQLTWGFYRGDRIGLYTVNSVGRAGYVDIDSAVYKVSR